MSIVFPRCAARAIVDMAKGCGAEQASTERGRDKKPRIAARLGGCFVFAFYDCLHIADHRHDVRVFNFANDFCEYRTSRKEP